MVFSGPRRQRPFGSRTAVPVAGFTALPSTSPRPGLPLRSTGQALDRAQNTAYQDVDATIPRLMLARLSFGANCASAPAVYLLMTGAKLRTGAVMSNTVSLLVGLACWSVVAQAQVVIRNPQNLDVPQAKVNVIYRTTLRVLSDNF